MCPTAQPPPPPTTAAPTPGKLEFPRIIPDTPVFLIDVPPQTEIAPGESTRVVCQVVSAEQITLQCGGNRIDAADLENSDSIYDPESRKKIAIFYV